VHNLTLARALPDSTIRAALRVSYTILRADHQAPSIGEKGQLREGAQTFEFDGPYFDFSAMNPK